MKEGITLFWFRRDLRLDDNAGLYHALKNGKNVLPIFIFDRNILNDLKNKQDSRVSFIHARLQEINSRLIASGSSILCLHTTPMEAFRELTETYNINAVFTNNDYEPYAEKRDREIAAFLHSRNIMFRSFKDQVVFEKQEVVKDNTEPYSVFTPYSKKWKEKLGSRHLETYASEKESRHFHRCKPFTLPSLGTLGFTATGTSTDYIIDEQLIRHYRDTRDIPALKGTSRLGIHLRFGTISIRHLAQKALQWNETFLNELIWREFFMMILWHYPRLINTSFRQEYDHILWRNNEQEFEAWKQGKTGYPIVDAGMRELNQTGFMHNRVRMITASFLCKHLLIDWRWGEAYFAERLSDYDLSANNGNWQWAAGCGCDAAPYFRIFSPQRQTEKFDPKLDYIRKWVPELETFDYPPPIVNHDFARKRCLEVYKAALKTNP